MLKLDFKPYTLQLKHVFRISRGARSSTPVMLVRISFDGIEGYGEASMPPLYGESFVTASEFLSKIDFSGFRDPFATETILAYVDRLAPGNTAAKAAVDIALHDLVGKLLKIPVRQLFGLPAAENHTCMTIYIDSPEVMAGRANEYRRFKYLKIKLGAGDDRAIIKSVRSVTDQPLFVDANQGWNNKEEALDFIWWLKEQNVVFIEQPMLKENKKDLTWLSERSPLPVIGDEGIQRLSDLREASSIYHGVNIKLVKSTGLREAFKMAVAARVLGMKVMVGCMSETSCAISAAAQLGALTDWLDLDGNLEIRNDPFSGVKEQNGQQVPNDLPGIGLVNPHWEEIL